MEPTNERRAAFGLAAVDAGTPDRGQNGADADGLTTDAGDAIANAPMLAPLAVWIAKGCPHVDD